MPRAGQPKALLCHGRAWELFATDGDQVKAHGPSALQQHDSQHPSTNSSIYAPTARVAPGGISIHHSD